MYLDHTEAAMLLTDVVSLIGYACTYTRNYKAKKNVHTSVCVCVCVYTNGKRKYKNSKEKCTVCAMGVVFPLDWSGKKRNRRDYTARIYRGAI